MTEFNYVMQVHRNGGKGAAAVVNLVIIAAVICLLSKDVAGVLT